MTLPRAQVHVAFSDLLKERAAALALVPAPTDGRNPQARAHCPQPLLPSLRVPGGAPRVGRRGCASHTGPCRHPRGLPTPGSLFVQRITAAARPGPPRCPRGRRPLHGSVSACALTAGLRVFLLSPRGLARPVCGPIISAAPPRCWHLAGGCVYSLDRRMRSVGVLSQWLEVQGHSVGAVASFCGRPLQLRCSAGVCGTWTRGSITTSGPSPWRLPASVCLQSSIFTGHQSYWMGTRPLQGSLSFIRSSHRCLVSKKATRPSAMGSVFNTSLGEQAQPQGED